MRWKAKPPKPTQPEIAFAFLPHLAEDGYWYWLEWVRADFRIWSGGHYYIWLGRGNNELHNSTT